jgi:hypothetical protein
MSRVWEAGPEKQAERFVLLAIADYANNEGECWPSIAGICRKTCMSERGVQTIIRRLEDQGWLHIETGNGRRNCNLYTVKTPQDMHPAGYAPPQMDAETPHMDTQTPHMDVINPAGDAPEPSLTIKNHKRTIIADDEFEAFWSVVPRKAGKGQAVKAWKAATKKVTPQTIIDAMGAYARQRQGQDQQYTAHPASWLNGERWLDEAAASPTDFYDNIQKHLSEKMNELPDTPSIGHNAYHRLSAPVSAPDTSGRRGMHEGNSGDSRGGERSYLSIIKPRKFP